MKKTFTLIMAIALTLSISLTNAQVMITQVYEGTSYNKCVEITNIGSAAVDLANPQITMKMYANATSIGTTLFSRALTGSLNPGQSMILYHPQLTVPSYVSTYSPKDTAKNICNFNGVGSSSAPTTSTDILALYTGATLSDVFSAGTFQWNDKSYCRNFGSTPNASWTESEWTLASLTEVANAGPTDVRRLGYYGAPSPLFWINYPYNNATVNGANQNISFTVQNFVVGTVGGSGVTGHIHYVLDGGAPVMVYTSAPIALTGLSAGSHQMMIQLVDNNHAPLSPVVSDTVTFTVSLAALTNATIYNIQNPVNPAGDSYYKDSTITASGVVTGTSLANGYFIQNGSGTFNGIYVFDATHQPALGDSVKVAGKVAEYYNCTEFTNISSYDVIASGILVPAPVSLSIAAARAEQYEGVLVRLSDVVCTKSLTAYWMVSLGADSISVDKLLYTNSGVVNNHYNITGIMHYAFSKWQIEPRSAADISSTSGVSSIDNFGEIKAYPNPANTVLSISNIKNASKIELLNIHGQTIQTVDIAGNNQTSINVENLNSGFYFVKIIDSKESVKTIKFFKQ